ncbi:MAG TPA: prepilin-type N-terminal cleavage/methylation domain-containing protein [Candidatus Saccharimonadales bacterium]
MLRDKHHQNGFTIVELLVVIVVIAILAAITIVAYNGIQTRAQISTIQSDLSAATKKTELFKINSTSLSYPISMAELQTADLSFSKANYTWVLYCTDTTSYVLAARMINTTRWWVTGNASGVAAESTVPGTSGSSATTCTNLGYPSTTYAGWIKSNSGWSL